MESIPNALLVLLGVYPKGMVMVRVGKERHQLKIVKQNKMSKNLLKDSKGKLMQKKRKLREYHS